MNISSLCHICFKKMDIGLLNSFWSNLTHLIILLRQKNNIFAQKKRPTIEINNVSSIWEDETVQRDTTH
jgi:hypothetical protein